MDLVTSCGPSARGEFAYTLNVTDPATGWCERKASLGRSEAAVVESLDGILKGLPFPVRTLHSDNGSEFLNYHLLRYCKRRGIDLSRSRPYKKDDNAHSEQKNWTHVRKLIGWDRYDTAEAAAAMNDLYGSVRLMMNLFQCSSSEKDSTPLNWQKKYNANSRTSSNLAPQAHLFTPGLTRRPQDGLLPQENPPRVR